MAKGRILAIDDERFFRQLYQDLLGGEGYQVRTAAGGEEALEILGEEKFDLVITDMQMPGMDGLATTEAIRKLNPDQEVMVVTGQKDVEKAVAAMKEGVCEYLLKPINPGEFLHVVDTILFRQTLKTEHGKLVTENIEMAELLAVYRKCLAFLQVHDLDRLADLVLDTLMELLRAEGAVLWLAGEQGAVFSHHCHRGLVRLRGGEKMLQPGDSERRRILAGEPFRSADGKKAWLPLTQGGEPLALVQVEEPAGREGFSTLDLKVAATAGEFAACALASVLRYRTLARKTLRAGREEAYHMAFLRDYLDRELQKARRYGRSLSLLRLRIDNFPELKGTFRDRELQEGIDRLLGKIRSELRDADILAMAEPQEYYVLLPETDFWGSLMIQKRIRQAVRDLVVCDLKKNLPLRIHLRGASFPGDGHSFEELNEAAGRRLTQIRSSLFQRDSFAAAPFWSGVKSLLGNGKELVRHDAGLKVSPRLAPFEDGRQSRFFRMPEERLEEVMRSFCREAAECHRMRGILYRSCSDFDQIRRTLPRLEAQERSATTLYLLGGKLQAQWELQRTVPVHIEDEHFHRIPFLLYLAEDQAYALFAFRREGELIGFHTADFYFVENMIAKLQEQYRLQVQI